MRASGDRASCSETKLNYGDHAVPDLLARATGGQNSLNFAKRAGGTSRNSGRTRLNLIHYAAGPTGSLDEDTRLRLAASGWYSIPMIFTRLDPPGALNLTVVPTREPSKAIPRGARIPARGQQVFA